MHSIQKISKAGLKVKLSKCQFFKTHLHYLGHRISANGLEPLPDKLEEIKNLAPARNIDKACQIFGLLGYYRSFVPAFANISLPITSFLKKNTPFVWSEKCQLTLDILKRSIMQQTHIAISRPQQTLCLVHRGF